MAQSASVKQTPTKRTMFAFDLDPKWAAALREVAEKHYPQESSPTGLVRQWVQELVGCFYTEKEMKGRGLLPPYRSQPNPELLLFATRQIEKRRDMPKVPRSVEATARPMKKGNNSMTKMWSTEAHLCPVHRHEMKYSTTLRDFRERLTANGTEFNNQFYYCPVADCGSRYSAVTGHIELVDLRKLLESDAKNLA